MLHHTVSALLIAAFATPTFATVGEQRPSTEHSAGIVSALTTEFLQVELKSMKDKHDKIDSWEKLERTIETFEAEDRSYLQAQLDAWKKTPFKRPAFETTESGFTLTDGGQRVIFNYREGTLTANGKTVSLDKQPLAKLHQWLTAGTAKTSYLSFVINDAHAVAPLVIGLVAFVVTSAGILWNSSCKKAFSRTERRVSDLARTCEWDLSQNRSSPEIRDLLRELSSPQNHLIRSSRQSCEEQLTSSFRWLFFFSCSENVSAVCGRVADLSRCLTVIRNRGAVNDSDLWKEGPAQRNRPARSSSGAVGQ